MKWVREHEEAGRKGRKLDEESLVNPNNNLHNLNRRGNLVMSRATIIDERPEEELETTDQLDTQDTVETPQEEEQPQEPDVPEKYQGKSVEELVQMHQELEEVFWQTEYGSWRVT